MSSKITRRAALAGTAALPLAAATGGPAAAEAHAKGPVRSTVRRFTLGNMEVTTLLVSVQPMSSPRDFFGVNVSEEEFNAVAEAAMLPADAVRMFFTPTLVSTGDDLILFDTGYTPTDITTAVESAGYSADDITKVVITHMHPDHIGGLSEMGFETFDADCFTGRIEWDHWTANPSEGFTNTVEPLAPRFTFLEDGQDVATGITAMAAFGHTPGHMAYRVASGDHSVLIGADFANHYAFSVEQPDWHFGFDADKEQAVETRRRILDMLAAERMPFIGYHMPFPGIGYIAKRGDAYQYVPESYQLMLQG